MDLIELVNEYTATRAPGWLVLSVPEVMASCVDATRYYAAYGNISSLSLSDKLPGVPMPGALTLPAPIEPEPAVIASLPVKDLRFIDDGTKVTLGEWAVIRPLFVLYAERENAMRLEASRAAGLEVYGRSVSEIAQDIAMMETETLPSKAFSHCIIEV